MFILIFFLSMFNFSLLQNGMAKDIVMSADEVSNTISILDAETSEILGQYSYGRPRDYVLLSSVKKFTQTNVHGLAVNPVGKELAITSNISNSVVIYKLTDLEKEVHYLNVGLSPHIAMYSADNSELWVASRGTESVEIFDTKKYNLKTKLKVSPCPSFFAFLKAKAHVFVSNVCTNKLEVYHAKNKKRIKTIELNGYFSPLITLSPDQKELWIIRKETDQVARIDTEKLELIEYVDVGVFPQHVAFIQKGGRVLAAVTVGGESAVKFYSFATGKTGTKLEHNVIVPGVPHGITVRKDQKKIFVAGEHSDKVYTIDADTMAITERTNIGNSPQSLITIADFPVPKNGLSQPSVKRDSIIHNLSGQSLVSGAEVTVRQLFQNFHFNFLVHGQIKKELALQFYMTDSEEAIKTKDKEKLIPIGFVFCSLGTYACVNSTSIPVGLIKQDVLKNPNLKMVAFDEEGKMILISTEKK